MGKKRTAYEQLLSILEEAKNPIARTKLSRRANIVYNKFMIMSQFLEERGLLAREECDPDPRMNGDCFMFHITLKGLDVLRANKDGYEIHEIRNFKKWKQNKNN